MLLRCMKEPPLFAGVRTGFDETTQEIVADMNGQGSERGAYQVCVVRKTMVVCWAADGQGSLRTIRIPLDLRRMEC